MNARQTVSSQDREPLAIVGIGCRFAGGIHDPESFWAAMCAETDGIVDVPADRWNLREFFSADPSAPGRMYVRQAGFVEQPIEDFDAQFFGISPREAGRVDPQQRLLLETTWEALEDAGIPPRSWQGRRIGVYVGTFMLDSMLSQLGNPANRQLIDSHTSVGTMATPLSARLSYSFDFRGPVLSVDTACSSSLVAMHLGCSGVWSGECEAAVVAGVNVLFYPEVTIALCKAGLLSPDFRCKAFDARANGYVRGEGAGVVLVRPLSAALADGNRIYALVRGTAVNSHGRSEGGMSVPGGEAQEAVLRSAYAAAGVDPRRVGYVEAHGTGTSVGDNVEARALGAIVGAGRSPSRPLLIGSVKTNIGHTEAAAGVAGLIKASLCLHHDQVPPNLHFVQPNPNIPFESLGLRVVRERQDFPANDGERLAGINSFGYGGTNGHVVLQGYAAAAPRAPRRSSPTPHVLTLSARSEPALAALAWQYVELLSTRDAGRDVDLGDVAYAAATRREALSYRAAVVATTPDEAVRQLEAIAKGATPELGAVGRISPASEGSTEVAWVYTGMGPQWWGMGRALMGLPVFDAAIREVDEALVRHSGWSIRDEMLEDEATSRMPQTQIAQVANLVIQVGLTQLLRSFGLRPAAIVGHSVGEVTAAWASGALSLAEATRVAYHRGRLQATTAGRGGMLAVDLSASEAQQLISRLGLELSVAAINSTSAVTIAGAAEPLAALEAHLARTELFHRRLQVEVPYHSPVMEPLLPELRAALADLSPREPTTPLWSTVTGKRAGTLDAAYWTRNMREPVHFAPAMASMIEAGHATFLEIGPHPVLHGYITEALKSAGVTGTSVATLNRKKPEMQTLWHALATLYTLGAELDFEALSGGERPFVSLPRYPWQRERHWVESDEARARRVGTHHHPLLGSRLPTPYPRWEASLGHGAIPYVVDHRVDGEVLLPGAAYCEAALAMARELYPDQQTVLENVALHKALILGPADARVLHYAFDRREGEVTIHSRTTADDPTWILHFSTRYRPFPKSAGAPRDIAQLRRSFAEGDRVSGFYQRLERRGYSYGPTFRNVQALWCRNGEVLAEIRVADGDSLDRASYLIHPAVLDACLHATLAALPEDGRAYLPVAIERIIFHQKPSDQLLVHSRVRPDSSKDFVLTDVVVLDESGTVVMELDGVKVQAVSGVHAMSNSFENWVFEDRWEAGAPVVGAASRDARHVIFVSDGLGVALGRRLAAADRRTLLVHPAKEFRRDGNALFVHPTRAEDFSHAVNAAAADQAAEHVFVFLWGEQLDSADGGVDPAIQACSSLTYLIQAIVKSPIAATSRLWVMTRGAQKVDGDRGIPSPGAGMLWSFARVVRNECYVLECRLVDLAVETHAGELEAVAAELASDARDEERALRQRGRFVARVSSVGSGELATWVRVTASADSADFEVDFVATPEPAHWLFRRSPRRAPGSDEVSIRVVALGTRISQTSALGNLCSGTVEAVGSEVRALRVGDRVVAVTGGRSGSPATVPAALVVPLPDSVSFVLGASVLPDLFARHALCDLAQLRAGERVLVFDDRLGLGAACAVLARQLGAQVIAAVGGDARGGLEGKTDLRQLATAFDVHSPRLADEIRRASGVGVDVVIDTNDQKPSGDVFLALASGGRLVRRVRRGGGAPWVLEPGVLSRGFSINVVDLETLLQTQPARARALLGDTLRGLAASGGHERASHALAASALDELTTSKRRIDAVDLAGKAVALLPAASGAPPLDADAAYVITGGFGGLGLSAAHWLAENGARHLVLIGRQGPASDAAQTAMRELAARGCRVVPLRADVTDRAQLSAAFDSEKLGVARVAGVVHAAGVFDFCLLEQLTEDRLRDHVTPKVRGAWNLHQLTRELELDFFVMVSSTGSAVGIPGLSAYAGANGYLDTLARHRAALGLPALSVCLGAVGDVGILTTEEKYRKNTSAQGFAAMPVSEVMRGLGHLIQSGRPNVILAEIEWPAVIDRVLVDQTRPRYSRVLQGLGSEQPGSSGSASFKEIVGSLSPEERRRRVSEQVRVLCARTLGMAAEKLALDLSLESLGLDSLMASQLREGLLSTLGVPVTTMTLLRGPTVAELSEHVLGLLTSTSTSAAQTDDLVASVDVDQLEQLLADVEAE